MSSETTRSSLDSVCGDINNKILWNRNVIFSQEGKQTVRKPLDSQKIKPSFHGKSIHQQQGDTDITLSRQPHTHRHTLQSLLLACLCIFMCVFIIHRFPSVDFSIFSTWKCTAVAHNVSPVRFLPVRFMHVLVLLLGSPQIQPHRGREGETDGEPSLDRRTAAAWRNERSLSRKGWRGGRKWRRGREKERWRGVRWGEDFCLSPLEKWKAFLGFVMNDSMKSFVILSTNTNVFAFNKPEPSWRFIQDCLLFIK